MRLRFVETSVFTRRVTRFGLEEALDSLQRELMRDPLAGVIDRGTGGCRKIRLADPERGRGKRELKAVVEEIAAQLDITGSDGGGRR